MKKYLAILCLVLLVGCGTPVPLDSGIFPLIVEEDFGEYKFVDENAIPPDEYGAIMYTGTYKDSDDNLVTVSVLQGNNEEDILDEATELGLFDKDEFGYDNCEGLYEEDKGYGKSVLWLHDNFVVSVFVMPASADMSPVLNAYLCKYGGCGC